MSRQPRVVVTRPHDASDDLIDRLERLGLEVVHVPAIEIGPPRSYQVLDRLVADPAQADWLLFTSRNAVRYFVQRSRRLRRARAVPDGVKVAVVGPATRAACDRAGIDVDLESTGRTGHDLAQETMARAEPGAAVVVVQAEGGRPDATELLTMAGFQARSVAAYRTRNAKVPPAVAQSIKDGEVDALAFASPSSVVSFAIALGGLGKAPASVRIAVIGQTTADACRRAGRAPDAVAQESSAAALADAVADVVQTAGAA